MLLIKHKGYDTTTFASELGWSRMKLYRKVTNPKQLKLGELATIAQKLDVPMCYLLNHEL